MLQFSFYNIGNRPFIGAKMMDAGKAVLNVRKLHQAGGASLANLYDPLKMPAELLAAHQLLDLAVDACYGIKKGFQSEARRVGWLFGRWGEVSEEIR